MIPMVTTIHQMAVAITAASTVPWPWTSATSDGQRLAEDKSEERPETKRGRKCALPRRRAERRPVEGG